MSRVNDVVTKTQTPKGTVDLMPDEAWKRQFMERAFTRVFESWGYQEIRTPTFEYFNALSTGTGVELQDSMFVFQDKSGRLLALRPENTASIARVAATKLLATPRPIRLYYIAPMFRYDEPQAGRQREFWQAGTELIGAPGAEGDAETISVFIDALQSVGLRDLKVDIGQVGLFLSIVKASGIGWDEADVLRRLIDKKDFNGLEKALVDVNCSEEFKKVFRRLPSLRGGKEVVNDLGELIGSGEFPEIKANIENLIDAYELLIDYGVGDSIALDLGIVRGLDYYTGTVFEAYVPEFGLAIGGGGRYDNLISEFRTSVGVGGEKIYATGFSIGIDRTLTALEKQGFEFPERPPYFMVIWLDDSLRNLALKTSLELRKKGFIVISEVRGRKLSSILDYANKMNVTAVILFGKKEIEKGKIAVKNMKTGEQEEVTLSKIEEYLSKISK
ncbi:MAG: histidine--tRNA ligase [Asgard group archaeon]